MSYSVSDQLKITLFDVKKIQYKSRVIFDYVQSCCTVAYIKKGEVSTTFEGKEYIAKTGDVMIHRPDLPFNVISKTDGIHYLFNIDLKVMEEVDFFSFYPMGKVVTIRDPELYEKKFDELRSLWLQEGNDYRSAQCSFLAFSLLHEIIESSKLGGKRSPNEFYITDRFNNVLHYIENRLAENITRNELAQIYHMNPVYFSRAFKEIYGLTPMKMVKKLRLMHAKRLLETTDDTIEQIAQKCGFCDSPHLNHTFRSAFKASPSEYRKSIKSTKRGVIPTLLDHS
ncbi:AraC family transcriptional regulator [Paenibacillus woosongensis]|uniref:AraC family transcriptional regulator n=1 Tax=Paenibacillus woosongensis TaxID=307580 RepID=A0AA95I8V8_9BACL|nr:AraC family transcriptional regulator [Paenibacillus woosongensis]WHX50107.1 AraC family transcriptional regulator [Paenibacillus woosongensis]